MKIFRPFIILCLLTVTGMSQILNENFNGGIPSGWAQIPTATWSLSPNLGTSGSGCALTQDPGFTLPTTSLRTPTLDLSGIATLTIAFKTALVKNNFVIPNIALSYSTTSGIQFLARWGSGFSSNTTYTLNGSEDFTPPLEAQNVNWEGCTHTLSVPANISPVCFIFDAELINSGYVLLEDILVTGTTSTLTTGLSKTDFNESISVFPNPVVNKKTTVAGINIQDVFFFDNQGRNLPIDFVKTDNAFDIDLTKLLPGIYYLTAITTRGVTIHKKIVVE